MSGGFANLNLLDDPYVASIPGFSSQFSAALLEIKLSSQVSRKPLDFTQYKGLIASSSRIGYEVGASLDMADLLAQSGGTSKATLDADSSGYSYIARMINWYENNWRRYGLASNPYGASGWPTTSYGSESGRYRFIYGSSVEPAQCVSWSQDKWSDAYALYKDVLYSIQTAIEAIDPAVSGAADINQYDYAALSTSARALALKEKQASDSFEKYVFGSDSDLSVGGVKVRKAYFTLTNIAGFLDTRFDLVGASLTSGSLVVSPRAGQDDTGAKLQFGLAPGFIPGLKVALSGDLTGGLSSIVEDYDEKTLEADPGEESWLGLKLEGSYDFGSLPLGNLGVRLSMFAPDFAVRPTTLAASAGADYDLAGAISASVHAEADFLLWNPRYVEDYSVMSYAGALVASGDYRGAGARLTMKYKKAGYGGLDGNDAADLFCASSAASDFDEAKLCDAVLADGGLYFRPAGLIGRDYGSVEGGVRLFAYGDKVLQSILGKGWYADLSIKMDDIIDLPLEIKLGYDHYENPGATIYEDQSNWPTKGLLANSTLTCDLVLKPSDSLRISMEASDADSGCKTDTSRVVSLGLYARLLFDASGARPVLSK